MDRLEKRIVLLHNLGKKRINDLLQEYQMSYEDYQIILALHYADGLSVSEMMNEAKVSSQVIERVLKHLQEKDYIEINDNKLYLTEKVQKLYPQIKKILKKNDEKLIQEIAKDEYHELVASLDKLIEIYE